MNPSIHRIALCLLAATTVVGAHADDRRDTAAERRQQAPDMQALNLNIRPGDPAHGWRYFVDARRSRAVVISPGGDYYYSHGEGLARVYPPDGAASPVGLAESLPRASAAR